MAAQSRLIGALRAARIARGSDLIDTEIEACGGLVVPRHHHQDRIDGPPRIGYAAGSPALGVEASPRNHAGTRIQRAPPMSRAILALRILDLDAKAIRAIVVDVNVEPRALGNDLGVGRIIRPGVPLANIDTDHRIAAILGFGGDCSGSAERITAGERREACWRDGTAEAVGTSARPGKAVPAARCNVPAFVDLVVTADRRSTIPCAPRIRGCSASTARRTTRSAGCCPSPTPGSRKRGIARSRTAHSIGAGRRLLTDAADAGCPLSAGMTAAATVKGAYQRIDAGAFADLMGQRTSARTILAGSPVSADRTASAAVVGVRYQVNTAGAAGSRHSAGDAADAQRADLPLSAYRPAGTAVIPISLQIDALRTTLAAPSVADALASLTDHSFIADYSAVATVGRAGVQ